MMSPVADQPIGSPRELSSHRLFCSLHFGESGASLHSCCQHASVAHLFMRVAHSTEFFLSSLHASAQPASACGGTGVAVVTGVGLGDAAAFAFAYSIAAAATESRNCLSVESFLTTKMVSALRAIAMSSPITKMMN